jgi:hypothetical protein
MLVRIVKDWPYPETFFGQTPKGDGMWDEIKFTEEPVSECDYLIVLQRPPYTIDVSCGEGNAWIITQEPPVAYFRFLTRSFKYFDRVYTAFREIQHPFLKNLHPVLPWHVLRSYTELNSLTINDLAGKSEDLVWITSSKAGFPGQKARMEFRQYLKTSKFEFKLFGRGFTPIHDKFDALFPAKYCLSIENFSTTDYWTEKVADGFLSWCLPFYWGAENLEAYFPSESFIRIDIHRPAEALAIIRKAITNREWDKRLASIEKARNLVLNEYQFFPFIATMIRQKEKEKKTCKKKMYHIPAVVYPWSYSVINRIKYYWRRTINIVLPAS